MGTVCAGSEEQVFRNAIRAFRPNAFRTLSLAADADSGRIDKQVSRLLVAIELDPARGEGACGLKGLTSFEISEAAHLLNQPNQRMLEELFWIHAAPYDLQAKAADVLQAARNQPEGPEAHHNFAVLLTIHALEIDPTVWEEALKEWKWVLGDSQFWKFLKVRAERLGASKTSQPKLAAAVVETLTGALRGQLTQAARARDVKLVSLLARSLQLHSDWLDFEVPLQSAVNQMIKQGFVSLGAVHDRVAELLPQEDKALLRRSLATAEEDLGCIAEQYGELASGEDWENALCFTYQRLILAIFNWLGEVEECRRVQQHAERFLFIPALLQRLETDWQHMLTTVLLGEAKNLLRVGKHDAAERKLDEASGSATEEQKGQIETLRETCGFARAAAAKQRSMERSEPRAGANDVSWSEPWRSPLPLRKLWLTVAASLACALGAVLFAGRARQSQVTAPPAASPREPQRHVPAPFVAEHHPLTPLDQSLAFRQTDLERQRAGLEKQRTYLNSVALSYQGELVPQEAKQIYDQLLKDNNRKLQQVDKDLAQWRADDAAYRSRLSALNVNQEDAK